MGETVCRHSTQTVPAAGPSCKRTVQGRFDPQHPSVGVLDGGTRRTESVRLHGETSGTAGPERRGDILGSGGPVLRSVFAQEGVV